jgi:ParB-like chromosome segregation protein Spo0J
MSSATKTVWHGPKEFRRFLVPLDSLEPFPDNPNQGDVVVVASSYARFGQRKTIVVTESRIVAGHTQVEAARSLGWTHIAAVDGEFATEEDARAFLIADNRTGELGGIDDEALAVQLAALRDDYEGTGYTEADRVALDEKLAKLRDAYQPTDDAPPPLDARSGTSGFFEVPLLLGRDDRKDFAVLVKMHQREWGVPDVTAIVLRLLRESATRL